MLIAYSTQQALLSPICGYPGEMSFRKHDSIATKVINELKRSGRPCTTLEVARALGMQNRKEINPTLYNMQKQGLLKKVQETPPLWQLTPRGTGVMQGVSGSGGHRGDRGRGRGRGRGSRGRGAPPTSSPPGYKFPSNPQYNFPPSATSLSANPGFGRGRGMMMSPILTTSTGTQNAMPPQLSQSPPLRIQIQEVLRRANKPLTALEIAKQLDFSSRSSVNPDLYAMEREGAVCHHQPTTNSAPLWFLPGRRFESSTQPPAFGVGSSSLPVARGGQTVERDLARRGRGRGAGRSPRKEQTVVYTSQSSEEEAMETEPASGPDLSHIAEDNIEERLVAILKLSGASSRKTELDLSKSIGSMNRSFTRSDIRPHLHSLEGKGVLEKMEGMEGTPVIWKLSANHLTPPSLQGPSTDFNPFSSGMATSKGGSSPQKVSLS